MDREKFIRNYAGEHNSPSRFIKDLDDLIGSLNADRWMPIDENTPRDGTWIQVWGVDFDCPMTAQWGLLNNNPHTTDFKYGWCGYGYIFTDLTHWQPLPKPPKEKP